MSGFAEYIPELALGLNAMGQQRHFALEEHFQSYIHIGKQIAAF
jgi:hypothetical protein